MASWPSHLGFDDPKGKELGIAFGWNARGTLWQATRSALKAGKALACLINRLRKIDPKRPVHLLAHSLGAQVAFSALEQVEPGDLSRIVVLNGAVFQSAATKAMSCTAGRRAQLFNVTSAENALFDFIFELLMRPGARGDRALGNGFQADNAITLRLNDDRL